jgi:hypothetical protein
VLDPIRTRCSELVARTCSRTPRSSETVETSQLAQGSRGKETEGTHRYEGRAAQMILKNRITRHESRNPSSKATGPSVPAENLSHTSWVTSRARERRKNGGRTREC